jgi:hypothetical protein
VATAIGCQLALFLVMYLGIPFLNPPVLNPETLQRCLPTHCGPVRVAVPCLEDNYDTEGGVCYPYLVGASNDAAAPPYGDGALQEGAEVGD